MRCFIDVKLCFCIIILISVNLIDSFPEIQPRSYADNARPAVKACQSYLNRPLDRIHGGISTKEKEFPWMVALLYIDKRKNNKASYNCGGTLISDLFVMTTATCVDAQVPAMVRLGMVKLIEDESEGIHYVNRSIERIIKHPNYSRRQNKNDIGLIKMSERVWLNDYILPACLYTDSSDLSADMKLIVTGWGSTADKPSSNELLKAEFITMPISECNAAFSKVNQNIDDFDESQYCTYDPENRRDSCQGDSGDPVQFFRNYEAVAHVVGIVSFGYRCATGLPSVSTRVSYYLDWIESFVWPPGFKFDEIRPSQHSAPVVRPAIKACQQYSILPNEYILGGELSTSGEFPWMAALGYLNTLDYSISFDCGGTLISPFFVMTADHCVRTRPASVVRLGKLKLTDEDGYTAVNHLVKDIIRHPNRSFLTKKNDIALIRVTKKIEFVNGILPACLETNLNDRDPNVELIVTGWGTVSSEKIIQSNHLLKAQVKSMPLSQCNATLLEFNKRADQAALRNGISQSQYCAYDPRGRNDSCQGDSGGPLQYYPSPNSMPHIIGIVSFGVSCGTGLPAIYTRVAYYLEWIESIVWPAEDPSTIRRTIN